jgi:hypothetical protein
MIGRINFFVIAAVAGIAPFALLSCSAGPEAASPQAPATLQQQQLAAFPEAFREVLSAESQQDQQTFLARPADQQRAIVEEWQRREKLMDSFTPTEQTIISTLSQDDSDNFFTIPADQRKQQEQFLADAETRYLDSLDDCLESTHRRFGPRAETKIKPQALQSLTVSEQALIKHLGPEETTQFLAVPDAQREQWMSDRVNRKVDQLLSCATHTNRRLGEPI